MKTLIRLSFAFAAGAVALSASADPRVPLAASGHDSVPALRPSYVRAAAPGAPQTATAATPKVMGSSTYPGVPAANGFRAYPPSCAADPLPDKASGPTWSARVPLYATDASGRAYTETVTATVWRLACSSSGGALTYNPTGAYNAMTLLRIDRDTQFEGDMNVWPTFPLVTASQGNIGFGTSASVIRVAGEPNTVIAETAFDSPIYSSMTYVLENYPYQGSGYFTFSDAFKLRIDPALNGVNPVTLSIPAYAPTQATYPDAFAPLPLDGYLDGNWFDPAHSGEGMQISVFGSDGPRTVFAAWYTYDPLGLPFWLVAQATIQPGQVALDNMPVYYLTGGGFAGAFGASANLKNWGTMSLRFTHCNRIDFSFNGRTDATTAGPGGSGTRTWQRAAVNNVSTCE
ncbi:MAG: hypothetical protein GXC76_02215 [Rhodanobacteraceae bacterium]|jgi:hypothetical protein|nr:hypothetical protein [Rhodanobacteraceae bacterium]